MEKSKKEDFDFEIEYLGKQELTEEQDKQISKMVEEAEDDLKEREARVNIRWKKDQLQLIKKVSSMIGIPYQTYIKDAVFRKSMEDLERFKSLSSN